MEESGNKAIGPEETWEDEEDEETKATKKKLEMVRRQEELMKRTENKDILEHLLVERHEAEQEETLLRAQEAREIAFLQALQTQKLGEELMRRKNDDIREQKLRQLLRNDSIELRRLEDEIRKAYAAKAAKTQLLEREICRKNSKIRDIEEDRMIQGWYQDDRFEKQQMLEAHRKKEQYRRDLQEQLASNQRQRQQKIEETRLERKLVEDTLTLGSENQENRRGKYERASFLLAEQKGLLEAREFQKSREKEAMLKEEKEYARMLADKMIEEKQSDHAKAALSAAKEAILDKMTRKMLNDEGVRREREDAINELIAEEQKNELENRMKNAAMEKNRIARVLWEDMERQKIVNEESKARQAEIDRAFAEYLEKECEKLVIADRRKQEERRAKGIQYGKDLREAIASSNLRYTENILENQDALERDRAVAEKRRKSIEIESSRMLREHETCLRGFLKSSVNSGCTKSTGQSSEIYANNSQRTG